MLYLLLFVIWIFVATGCHLHYWTRRDLDPKWWKNRHMELKPFTEQQWLWLMTLWPLAIVAGILFIVLLLILGVIDRLGYWWSERKAR